MRGKHLVVPALAAICLWLSACGSSDSSNEASEPLSSAAYTQLLNRLSQHENEAHQAIEKGLRAGGSAQIANALSAFAADQEARADELASTTPPKNAEKADAQLERAFRDSAAALHQLIPEVESAGSTKEAIAALQSSEAPQNAGQELDSALGELKKLGYASGS